MKTLGLDLSTSSIGWALIENEKILDTGCRIFPKGVEKLGEGEGREQSKNACRTENRGIRRKFFRRRLRKRYLLKALSKHQMSPIHYSEVKHWNDRNLFENPLLLKWFQLNPYKLRSKAIKEPISLLELGRILYHLIQRRGFESNSRIVNNDEKGKIYKGFPTEGKIGIHQTSESILENKTLGSYLQSIYPPENAPFKNGSERIRNRYTTRKMYIEEFEAIWEYQQQFHPELTKELKTIFGGRKKEGYKEDGILFHQRPLRSQKHLVGNCSLEPSKTKCKLSAIPNQYKIVYQFVNNIKCDVYGSPVKITKEEREKIIILLLSKEKVTFKEIRKTIGKLHIKYHFNYQNKEKIEGSHTISHLSNKKFFGKKWFEFSEKEQEDIWHVLDFFDDRNKLKQYAIKKWNFDETKAKAISEFRLKEGYTSLSRKAINHILPFLKVGYTYDMAIVLGGVKNALGRLFQEYERLVLDCVPSIVNNKEESCLNELKLFLKSQCNASEEQLKKLYYQSTEIKNKKLLDALPQGAQADKKIKSIRNPVAITVFFEMRKLVNEIINEYGKPDQIKIQLARDLKVSKQKRNQIRYEQQRLEKQKNRVKRELEKLNKAINHNNILKYKLWEECNRTCPYTGKSIEIDQLFSNEVQIEYIFPWSRSLNDSFLNKTLCFTSENRTKEKNTPYEYYNKQGENKWEEVKLNALNCFKPKPNYLNAYNKFKHFIKVTHNDDFAYRQLNDTRDISREAKNYLSKICDNVSVFPVQMTSKLRHYWGLNTILNTENTNTRYNYLHHAIDALVIACSNQNHLHELTKWNRYDRNVELKNFTKPWQHFYNDALKAIDKILISHKKTNNLLTVRTFKVKKNGVYYKNIGVSARGQLHKESVYGKRKSPNGEVGFHIRKPLEDITTEKQVDKIVDSTIRLLILKRIEYLGGFVKGKIPKNAFFTFDENGIKQPHVFLPNRNGDPVPVKKIRIKENISNAEPLKEHKNQYVNPRKNHHVLIYKDYEGNLKEEVVTFWTAVERKLQKQSVFQLPRGDGKEIVSILQINDMFLLGLKDENIQQMSNEKLQQHLYRVQKFTSEDYYFRKHQESKLDGELGKAYHYIKGFGTGKTGWKTFNPIKVKISCIGKIQIL